MQHLIFLLTCSLLCFTQKTLADFVTPQGQGTGSQVIDAPWVIGSEQTISWSYATSDPYNLTLCQQNIEDGSEKSQCKHLTPIKAYSAEETQRSAEQSLNWTVTQRDFALQVSNLFCFQLTVDPAPSSYPTSPYFLIKTGDANSTASTNGAPAITTGANGAASSSSTSSSSLSTPSRIGLGVGLGLGIPVLAVLGCILFLLLKRNKGASGIRQTAQDDVREYWRQTTKHPYEKPELDFIQVPAELANGHHKP